MNLEVYILELSTYNNNTIKLRTSVGEITAHLVDMNQWDNLYDLLDSQFTIRIVGKDDDDEHSDYWIKLIL